MIESEKADTAWLEPLKYAQWTRARTRYFELSERIRASRDIYDKLTACEESFKVLKKFVETELAEYEELPPKILCRDVAPKLYMQLGEFEKARRAIKICAEAGTYDDDGAAEFDYLTRYETTARTAIEFLREHKGILQRDVYKAFAGTAIDKACLKEFLRASRLIRKEKSGTTNKLFLAE